MNIYLNDKILKKYKLSLGEMLLLCSFYDVEDKSLDTVISKLQNNGFLETSLFSGSQSSVISAKGKTVVKEAMDNPIIDKLNEFDYKTCVAKIRELYPKGSKHLNRGTYQWRSNPNDVTIVLKWFMNEYKHQETDENGNITERPYTQEEIVDAVKRYVDSFHGAYEEGKMKILRNFIRTQQTIYDENGNGHYEYVSDLSSWIETDTLAESTQEFIGRVIYG